MQLQTRTKERQLSDAEYYSDDDVLLSMYVSFRIEHMAQIGDFALPKVEDDGEFMQSLDGAHLHCFQDTSLRTDLI